MTDQARGRCFLGLDLSTQGLKATLIDDTLAVVRETHVSFDDDLPEFHTEGGVHRHADGHTVTSPPLMWVAAVDMLFERMISEQWPLQDVSAVSGSAQQHGSVWLHRDARHRLRNLTPDRTLREQFDGAFSVPDSPVWMDTSTSRQCAERETALGGAQAVADLTGSRAYERFTGNQIARVFQSDPTLYRATDRIMLVSAFAASLFLGDPAPMDHADASGMNLMDIRSKTWSPAALDCTAPDLDTKLGPLVPSHSTLGTLHGYFVTRYGMRGDCAVIAFSGDNPNSLAGLRLQRQGDVAISLGTSDTVFGVLSTPTPSAEEGHIFVNPVDPETFMALICYKNGSLTRESVRDSVAGGSWDAFNAALSRTSPGNSGQIGFYVREPEITPPIVRTGTTRFDAEGKEVDRFRDGADARAVVEGQALSMRLHTARVGLTPERLLATGGASANRAILQILADVFGLPVHVGAHEASAALGAAYRALHGWTCLQRNTFVPFTVILAGTPDFRVAARADAQAHRVYQPMLERYAYLERQVMAISG